MKKYILSALAVLAALSAPAQNTTKLTSSKTNDFGIAYSLPRTEFDIVVETEFTQQQPGEFSNYANRYLSFTKAITEPQYSSRIKSVTFVPRGVSDPDNRWLVELKGGNVCYMLLNDAGAPVSINTENVPADVAVVLPVPVKAEPTVLETEAASHAVTQEMLASTSTSKRAALAAQRIFELRDTRNEIISGQAENMPPDGKAMQLVLDNLAAQEAALTAMFLGTTRTWTEVNTLHYVPADDENGGRSVLARLSPVKGIVDADDLSGSPVYLVTEVLSTGEIPTDAAGQPKKQPKDGVAYNIPGQIRITVEYDGKNIASEVFEVAQIGKRFLLDPKIFTDKKNPQCVIFNPLTGGIRSISTRQQ